MNAVESKEPGIRAYPKKSILGLCQSLRIAGISVLFTPRPVCKFVNVAIGIESTRWRIFPASCMFGVIRDRGIKILHPANWIRGPLRAGYFRTSVARTLAILQQHHGYSLRLLDRNFGQSLGSGGANDRLNPRYQIGDLPSIQ